MTLTTFAIALLYILFAVLSVAGIVLCVSVKEIRERLGLDKADTQDDDTNDEPWYYADVVEGTEAR